MKKTILFVDPVAPVHYDERTSECGALGGTESSVLRVAGALAARHSVLVAQGAREWTYTDNSGVLHIPYRHKSDLLDQTDIESVVVVRSHKILPRLRRQFPDARLFLWMHCLPGRRLRGLARICADTDTMLVAVSDFHRRAMRRFLAQQDPEAAGRLRMIRIHNPLAPGLVPDGSAWDPDKLLFLSSPRKGLEQVLDVFSMLKRRCPSMRLCIANPGYANWRVPRSDGVFLLGTLPHREVLRHLRDSLCLFQPQYAVPEIFALVFAEANAVGTPVLAHPQGAAPEIVGDDGQLRDCRLLREVCNTVLDWRAGKRPVPDSMQRFAIDRVAADWERLLGGAISAPEMWRVDQAACAEARA